MNIAQSRQQLSSLIAAAQKQPQVITNRNNPVAVLVSADYFQRTEAAVQPQADSLYSQVLQLRAHFMPSDETGLDTDAASSRAAAWQRPNAFGDTD